MYQKFNEFYDKKTKCRAKKTLMHCTCECCNTELFNYVKAIKPGNTYNGSVWLYTCMYATVYLASKANAEDP